MAWDRMLVVGVPTMLLGVVLIAWTDRGLVPWLGWVTAVLGGMATQAALIAAAIEGNR